MTDKPPFELPHEVKEANLSEEAEKLYRDTYDEAWTSYGRSPKDETRAHAIAWAEVRKQFPSEDIESWKQEADKKIKSEIDPRLQ